MEFVQLNWASFRATRIPISHAYYQISINRLERSENGSKQISWAAPVLVVYLLLNVQSRR